MFMQHLDVGGGHHSAGASELRADVTGCATGAHVLVAGVQPAGRSCAVCLSFLILQT